MSKFRKKRDYLETFVQEQIIGPGAYNKSYFFLKDWETNEFANKDIESEPALDNLSEVIPEVPAYQYSSAILFPEVKIAQESSIHPKEINTEQNSASDIIDENDSDTNTSADDENINDSDSESLVSRQQNYPTSMGLSFVVDKNTDLQEDLLINVSFRTYRLIKKQECFTREIACRVPEYQKEIKNIIENYFDAVFQTRLKDGNLFISLKSEIKRTTIYDIDYLFMNSFLHKQIVSQLKEVFSDKLTKNSKDEFFISAPDYDYRCFSIKSHNPKRPTYTNIVTLYDDSIIKFIKSELAKDINNYDKYRELIKSIEIYNQVKSIVTNLKSVFKEYQATPIWESTSHSVNLNIPKQDLMQPIFRTKTPSPVDESNDKFKNLQYSVQYIRKEEKLYIKMLLLNKNSITLNESENKQLNKKDEANSKSLFGIKLSIYEKKENCLLQYNPPQILDFDQEDSFNKLLYRNYLDYGEGYNTSVEWGVQKETENLKYIATDYLPSQETPLVDYKPSKIVKGEVVGRLENTKVLSMRFLSTLWQDTVTDKEIVESLISFIGSYKQWIEEKQADIEAIDDLNTQELTILVRQLKSCEMDYNRLLRNIQLLANNPEAMLAFKVMNTAMFMQLHHSLTISQKKTFGCNTLSEQYYKEVQLDREYEWRSFQLAFVLLNIDAFVKPTDGDKVVDDVFGTGWPERNEVTDLVWFPTGGGKTEAYLGIIAFMIAYRRFTKAELSGGTNVLMRYTLRLLTLQQFQRATMLICALEVIRKDSFTIDKRLSLGDEKITIGLFVGEGSLPNKWSGTDKSMVDELNKISQFLKTNSSEKSQLTTSLPFTNCPWCNEKLFIEPELKNIHPNLKRVNEYNNKNERFKICCNNDSCTFCGEGINKRSTVKSSLPIQLFDDDIYRFPPTLLFGTVDKFATLANNISTGTNFNSIDRDSRRLVGKGVDNRNVLPPELIIQDELHLLLGPLGSAVGLYEKGIDFLCTYTNSDGQKIKPKIITSTATTRNTDKQVFALFNRRAEIFPKQGITCDDSFFAYYKREAAKEQNYLSNRKYIGVLPIGKTQVWMQLRIASIALVHRIKYLKKHSSLDDIFKNQESFRKLSTVLDYYHTVLSYFNSLKDVGKTQSQLSHYLPGDINYITKNTIPWSFLNKIISGDNINYSELTGRLTGEEVKTNLELIESKFELITKSDDTNKLSTQFSPELVIATNMISVGIDVSRFNTMIISSMPRNIAEYIQASSRVARAEAGVVFTIHHPFRSRDISHYQKYREFHEKFYSYVEPISVTPFANKSLDKYLAMLTAVFIRHTEEFNLSNNDSAGSINEDVAMAIKQLVLEEINLILTNADALESYLKNKSTGLLSSIDGIISQEDLNNINSKLDSLFKIWMDKIIVCNPPKELSYRKYQDRNKSLFISAKDANSQDFWRVSHSLREIAPATVIKTVQQ